MNTTINIAFREAFAQNLELNDTVTLARDEAVINDDYTAEMCDAVMRNKLREQGYKSNADFADIPEGSVVYDTSSLQPAYYREGKLYFFGETIAEGLTLLNFEELNRTTGWSTSLDRMRHLLWVNFEADIYPEAVSEAVSQ